MFITELKYKVIKQLLLGIFLIFIFIKVYALEFEYFQCPSESSALKCSQNCLSYGTIKFESKIEDDKNIIFLLVKDQNNTTSETLKNCVVKDTMNWSCTLVEIFSSSKHIMNNGKYFSSLSYRMLDGMDEKKFTCALN